MRRERAKKTVQVMQTPRPALLPSLLLRRNWDDAIDRVISCPTEASVRGTQGELALHSAITSMAPVRLIRTLIEANPDALSEKDIFGRLPLHRAVDFETLHSIVSTASDNAKAEDNPINRLPQRALELSPSRRGKASGLLHADSNRLENNRIQVVDVLLSAFPSATRLAGDNGRLPLHVAAWCGAPTQVVEMLLDVNPQAANKFTRDGNLAIHLAARKVKVGDKGKMGTKKEDAPKKGRGDAAKGAKGAGKGAKGGTKGDPGAKGARKFMRSPDTPARPTSSGGRGKTTPGSSSPKNRRSSVQKTPLQKHKEHDRKARQHVMKYLRDAEAYTKKAWPESSPEDDRGGEEEEEEGATAEQKEEKRLAIEEDRKAAHAIAEEIARCEARIKNVFLKQDRKAREREQLLAENREKERELERERLERLEAEGTEAEGFEGEGPPTSVVVPRLAIPADATSDPVVKLLAKSISRNGRVKTRFLFKTEIVEKNCKNPRWDEYFELTLGEEFTDHGHPLTLQVFDYDNRDGDDPCGCVVIHSVGDLPNVEGEAKCKEEGGGEWEELIPNPDPSFKGAKVVTGALRYRAAFDPTSRLLKIHIMEARDLAPKDFGVKVKKVKKPEPPPPAPKPKKEKKLEAGLEVLDLLLRYNCDASAERDGTGYLPKHIVKNPGAKVLLDGLNMKKNLVRWSRRENKTGDKFNEPKLTMSMSEDVRVRVMQHEEERGLVFEDHRLLAGGDGEEDFGGFLDSARSALDYMD